jgi:hypothetical protein
MNAWILECTPNLKKICSTCLEAVWTEIPKRFPISPFDFPWISHINTSRSRSVNFFASSNFEADVVSVRSENCCMIFCNPLDALYSLTPWESGDNLPLGPTSQTPMKSFFSTLLPTPSINFYGDRPAFRFFRFGEFHFQYPVFERGFHFIALHFAW